MSGFFIDRPIFAWVVAIVVMMIGALSIYTLPIAQYPTIAPPAVSINAQYPGADAETVQNSVTQVIEQNLKGLDGLLYFSSNSSSDGSVQITATFQAGTNPDIAQVQVQNKLQQATPSLPQEVQQQGLTVSKSQSSFLLIVGLYCDNGQYTNFDISDYLVSKLQDPLSRVNGVGNLQVFGSEYAMRIWLNPYKLYTYKLMPSDIRAAVLAQNAQVSAGQIGGLPYVAGQQLNATVTAQSRLRTADEFRNIILRTEPSGAQVRLGDVARVEIGSGDYSSVSRFNGMPAAGIAVQLAPGANALTTADGVKKRAEELSSGFPAGMKLVFPVDNTSFIRVSIQGVEETLIEAIILVVIVMFVFLQDWRATLIPAIAVPVVLLGTMGVLAAFGYSINTLTMFALVLAIGLLVDDAIVVVENVERIMREEGLDPKEATKKSMTEITGALVGIAMVLSAVFLPMAFFGGSTGVIYRQFSVTIVSAMALSVLVAIVLTPALCATILKPISKEEHADRGRFFNWFNRNFERMVDRYEGFLSGIIARRLVPLIVYAVFFAAMIFLFLRLPSGFLPDEDQGAVITLITTPPGAVQSRTLEIGKMVEQHFLKDEADNIEGAFVVVGFSFAGSGQNTGISFVHLKDWSQRSGAENHAQAIAMRAMRAFSTIRDAQVFSILPPSVPELGRASGFDFELEDRGNLGHAGLVQARNKLLGMAAQNPVLQGVRPNGLDDTPQLHINVDQTRAGALGVAQANINDTLTSAWASSYINDFLDRGRVKQVYMQGDAAYRSAPDDLNRWYVRTANGDMAPFSSFATTSWTYGPSKLERYNGNPSFEIQGGAAPGQSTGTAMDEMEKLVGQLGPDVGFDWTGISYQERLSGSQAPALYAISILVVFLCLAALYESWSIPTAVLLVIPLGVVGALLAATLRGLYNDVYFQVGLLTTIGLAAKNAILIVEFAQEAQANGKHPREAAMEAARTRLRPILMTSIAFIAGVFPLAISSGAGAASQNDIGTGVIGGMLTATVLAIFYVPLFFVIVRTRFAKKADGMPADPVAVSP